MCEMSDLVGLNHSQFKYMLMNKLLLSPSCPKENTIFITIMPEIG